MISRPGSACSYLDVKSRIAGKAVNVTAVWRSGMQPEQVSEVQLQAQADFDLASVLGLVAEGDVSEAGDGDAPSLVPEDPEDEDSLGVDGLLSEPLLELEALLELDLAGRLSVR